MKNVRLSAMIYKIPNMSSYS